MAKSKGMVVVWVIFGGLLGGFLGNMLTRILPAGFFQDMFLWEKALGFSTVTLDLAVITLNFGLMLHFSLCAILGILAALYLATK